MITKMNKLLLILLCLMPACASAYGIQVCAKQLELNVYTATLWDKTEIRVCWHEDAMDNKYVVRREVVQDIINDTWNAALAPEEVPEDEWVQFVGFEECGLKSTYDIRIQIDDGQDRVDGLGTDATYTNFNWSNPDIPQWNIERVAIHEFGHLLGLAHEHNRKDTDGRCSWDPQGTDGTDYYGRWDHNSVMNYCNDRYHESVLSPSDEYWIKRVYYPGYYEFDCETYVGVDDD